MTNARALSMLCSSSSVGEPRSETVRGTVAPIHASPTTRTVSHTADRPVQTEAEYLSVTSAGTARASSTVTETKLPIPISSPRHAHWIPPRRLVDAVVSGYRELSVDRPKRLTGSPAASLASSSVSTREQSPSKATAGTGGGGSVGVRDGVGEMLGVGVTVGVGDGDGDAVAVVAGCGCAVPRSPPMPTAPPARARIRTTATDPAIHAFRCRPTGSMRRAPARSR